MKVAWAIKANGVDVTANFKPYLISINVTDSSFDDADTATIILDNYFTKLKQPVQGDELEICLGYENNLVSVGKFTVDKAAFSGPPDVLTITCKASTFVNSEYNKLTRTFKDQKVRSWEPLSIYLIAAMIAAEHGIELVTPGGTEVLQAMGTPHLDQKNESDIAFLQRITKPRGLFVKVANFKLIVGKLSQGVTVNSKTGQEIPAVILRRNEVTTYSGEWSEREVFDASIAYWHDPKTGVTHFETAGSGNRIFRFKVIAPDQQTAKDWAVNVLDRSVGSGGKMSMSMPGRTDLQAEQLVTCEGFPYPLSDTPNKNTIAKKWVIKSVDLSMSTAGFTTSITGEPYKDKSSITLTNDDTEEI